MLVTCSKCGLLRPQLKYHAPGSVCPGCGGTRCLVNGYKVPATASAVYESIARVRKWEEISCRYYPSFQLEE